MPLTLGMLAATAIVPISIAAPTHQNGGTNASTNYTVDIGTASPDRIVLVFAANRDGSASVNMSSVVINGVTATRICGNTAQFNYAVIYAAVVPAGTGPVTITTNWAQAVARQGASFYVLRNANLANVAFDTDTGVKAHAMVAGGAAFGGACSTDASPANYSWTGLTEDYDGGMGSTLNSMSNASQPFAIDTAGSFNVAGATGMSICYAYFKPLGAP